MARVNLACCVKLAGKCGGLVPHKGAVKGRQDGEALGLKNAVRHISYKHPLNAHTVPFVLERLHQSVQTIPRK